VLFSLYKKKKKHMTSSARCQRVEALERSARLEIERDSVVSEIGDCDRTLAFLHEQLQLVARIKQSWVEQKKDEQRRISALLDAEQQRRALTIEDQTVELERILYDQFLPGLRKIHQQQRGSGGGGGRRY
jgi:hypothetical protein